MPAPSSSAEPPTPQAFAVDCIEKWWRTEGRKHYPQAQSLQILADGGGSNSSTARALEVQPATSPLQPPRLARHRGPLPARHVEVEPHRTPPVLRNQQELGGPPLDSYETILNYLRTTRTSTGLRVRAHLVRKTYKTGVKVTDAQMRELRITPNRVMPKWNYTIEPT